MQPLIPFKPTPPDPAKVLELRDWAARNGMDPDDVNRGFDADMRGDWFGNDTYVVIRLDAVTPEGWPDMVWLSIRRQDRGPIRDWRDMQAIKSQLVGPECEGVELYPAERFPFGFGAGLRSDDCAGGAVQRARAGS